MNSFDGIVDKYFPTIYDRWHILVMITLIPVMGHPFVMFGQIALLTPDYHCQQPRVNSTFLSAQDILNLSIPLKPDPQQPPRIGQVYEPCIEYNIDRVWPLLTDNISLSDALILRNELYPNLTTRQCTHGVAFNASTAVIDLSVGEDFKMVCDRTHLASLSNTIYMIGMFCGFIMAGPLSDNFGRRPLIVIPGIIAYVLGLIVGSSPNIWVFLVIRFVIAVALNVMFIIGCIFFSEIVSRYGRNSVSTVRKLTENIIARLALVLILYTTQNWRIGHAIFAYPAIFIIPGFFLWIESPRWLVSQGRTEESYQCVLTILRINGRTLSDEEKIELKDDLERLTLSVVTAQYQSCEKEDEDDSELEMNALTATEDGVLKTRQRQQPSQQRRKSGIRQCNECVRLKYLFQNSILRSRILLVGSIFILQAFLYYGLNFYSVRLEGNTFVIAALTSLVNLPGAALQYIAFRFFDRKRPITVFYVITSICLTISFFLVLFGNRGTPVIVSSTVGHAFVDSLFTMIYIRAPELFPSTHRSTALGFATGIARFGSITATYVERLDEMVWSPLPLLLFTIAGIIATILSLFMPPGRGEMDDTLEERL